MLTDRLARQVAFLLEADKLKSIVRRTPIADNSRLENSAEHSWHLALAAMALEEYAPAGTDLMRVIRMLVVHDLVEVDAGDTFAYDLTARIRRPIANGWRRIACSVCSRPIRRRSSRAVGRVRGAGHTERALCERARSLSAAAAQHGIRRRQLGASRRAPRSGHAPHGSRT
jgi:hypothetical protein